MAQELVRLSGDIIGRPRRTGWRLWALAILVGVLVGAAVVAMRVLIAYLEFLFFGAASQRLTTRIASLPWMNRMIGPVIGGCLVALLLRVGVSLGWGPKPHAFGFPDLVAARRLRGTIRAQTLSLRDAFVSVLIAMISLGAGASAGRESPAMHLGASLAMLPGRLLGLDASSRRMLLGMGAAAALAAVLHTPIAAIFLIREVVLPRQRFLAMGPVAVASFVGWLMSRWLLGDAPPLAAPHLGAVPVAFELAAPLAAIPLAFVGWAAVWTWTHTPRLIDDLAGRIRYPLWLLPPVGALLIGVLAIAFPPVTGIGYAPLAAGLGGHYSLTLLLAFVVAKIAASAVAVAFRFGGGRIAPALFVGAMAGGAIGAIAALFVDDVAGLAASAQAFYGLIGMGVVLAVLLEAPLASAVLVFELSGSAEAGIAALIGVYIATLVVRRLAPPVPDPTTDSQPLHWS
jgi:CIC family chloride channel protein